MSTVYSTWISTGTTSAYRLFRECPLGNVITPSRRRITNAVAEGLNSTIKAIKRRAGSSRNPNTFTIDISFDCGGLRLPT